MGDCGREGDGRRRAGPVRRRLGEGGRAEAGSWKPGLPAVGLAKEGVVTRLCGATFRSAPQAFDTSEIGQNRKEYPRQADSPQRHRGAENAEEKGLARGRNSSTDSEPCAGRTVVTAMGGLADRARNRADQGRWQKKGWQKRGGTGGEEIL